MRHLLKERSDGQLYTLKADDFTFFVRRPATLLFTWRNKKILNELQLERAVQELRKRADAYLHSS
jgi:hypothetical protein